MVLVSACLSKNKTEINEREWREKEKQKQSYYMILGKKDLELVRETRLLCDGKAILTHKILTTLNLNAPRNKANI